MRNRGNDHKAVCFTFWFSGHNNARYTALFPRLASVVRFHMVTFSRYRVLRTLQYRLWRALDRRVIYPLASRILGRKHPVLFTVDLRQIRSWKGPVVADVDDPTFDPGEVNLLKLPQVSAIVVTTETVKNLYQHMGVEKPLHVIPQGVSARVDRAGLDSVRERFKGNTGIIVGYLAPTLTLACDGPARFRQGLDDLDLLLAATAQARRSEPRIRLWLLGRPSASVKRRVRGTPWATLFDFVPLSHVLPYVANFDIGAYPRTRVLPPGRYSVKLAQYMACGVPIVTTAVSEAGIVREAGSGIVCDSPEAFGNALASLARSPEMRAQFATAGRRYAESTLDWARLVHRYEAILRDLAAESNSPKRVLRSDDQPVSA